MPFSSGELPLTPIDASLVMSISPFPLVNSELVEAKIPKRPALMSDPLSMTTLPLALPSLTAVMPLATPVSSSPFDLILIPPL